MSTPSDNGTPEHAATAQRFWKPARRGRWTALAIVLFSAAAVLSVLRAWQLPPFAAREPSTDLEHTFIRVAEDGQRGTSEPGISTRPTPFNSLELT
jgi:hypothetical protein